MSTAKKNKIPLEAWEDIVEKETIQEETVQEEIIQEETIQEDAGEKEPDINKDFDDFVNSTSQHEFPDKEENKEEQAKQEEDISSAMVDNFKLQMFTGLLFLLLDGVHSFLFRFVSKYDVKSKDIAFDEADKEAVQIYFNTPRVMNFINKMPAELIGFMHVEYIYYQKFAELKEEGKLKRKGQKVHEEEEEEDAQEYKAPAKKAAPKRKPKRKAPAKKAKWVTAKLMV